MISRDDRSAKALTREACLEPSLLVVEEKRGKRRIDCHNHSRLLYAWIDRYVASMKGRLWERGRAPQLIGPRRKRRLEGVRRRVRSKSTVNMRDKRFSLRGKRTFDGPCAERKFSPGKILDAGLIARKLLAGTAFQHVSPSFSFSRSRYSTC